MRGSFISFLWIRAELQVLHAMIDPANQEAAWRQVSCSRHAGGQFVLSM
jgi:hypothetical protein